MSAFNQFLFQVIYSLSHRNIFLDDIGIFSAKYLPYVLVIGFLLLAWYEEGLKKKLYLFFEGALAVILARGLITEAIKFFYYHPRPFDVLGFTPLINESGSSFPSGHAAWFFALAMIVWYANRKWGIWYFILAAFMGIARIYVGVHWPLDILGGAVVGVVSAMVIHWLLRRSREELSHSHGKKILEIASQ